jgi:hypothetical protein
MSEQPDPVHSQVPQSPVTGGDEGSTHVPLAHVWPEGHQPSGARGEQASRHAPSTQDRPPLHEPVGLDGEQESPGQQMSCPRTVRHAYPGRHPSAPQGCMQMLAPLVARPGTQMPPSPHGADAVAHEKLMQ